jgi:hypothetical protein
MVKSQEMMWEEIQLEIQSEMWASEERMQALEQRMQSKMEEMDRLLLIHLRE